MQPHIPFCFIYLTSDVCPVVLKAGLTQHGDQFCLCCSRSLLEEEPVHISAMQTRTFSGQGSYLTPATNAVDCAALIHSSCLVTPCFIGNGVQWVSWARSRGHAIRSKLHL